VEALRVLGVVLEASGDVDASHRATLARAGAKRGLPRVAHNPARDVSAATVRRYFLDNASEVRALSFFHTLSALALPCFAAYLGRHLRTPTRSSGAPALAFGGGVTAAAFLLLSALLVLSAREWPSRPQLRRHESVVMPRHDRPRLSLEQAEQNCRSPACRLRSLGLGEAALVGRRRSGGFR
jgi:hypothetical protein